MNESLLARWRRRAISIPLYAAAWSFLLVSAPLWIPLLAVLDLLRGSAGLRLMLVGFVFLTCELLGLAIAFGLWLRRPFVPGLRADPAAREARFREGNYALQAWWIGWIFGAATRLFRMKIELSGTEALERGPMLLFLRHTSMADTALAATQITIPYGIALRYVMKEELLWDPCLDVVGNRLPNTFARRGSDKPADEIARVASLVRDLAPNEGVLIYPEGTRFTPSKRARAIERFRERGDQEGLARGEALRHVLPPRLGGPSALLEANPGLDLVVGAHTGLEAAGTLAACWRGALLDRTIRLQFWRTPFASLPTGQSERERFIHDCWKRVDDWVEENREA